MVLRNPEVAGDVTPAGPQVSLVCGLSEFMLSPTRGGGELLALRRLPETPQEICAPAGGRRWGCGLLSHPTDPLRLGVGALSLARIGCRLRPPPRAPRSPGEVASWRAGCGAAAPRSAAAALPRLPHPCTEPPGALPCPHLGSSGLLLPTTCFPGSLASTLSSATSTSESGLPSRHPARRRPPSFVVR